MYVLKYFFEEPAPLGLGYRGYVAATDLDTGRRGASVLPETLTRLVTGLLPTERTCFWRDNGNGVVFGGDHDMAFEDLTASDSALSAALTRRARGTLIVGGHYQAAEHGAAVAQLLEHDIREAAMAARLLIDAGLTLLLPEPSHDGLDWALYAPAALSARAIGLLGNMVGSDLEAFVIPFQKARAEHKFYFELYDRSLFDVYRVGVTEKR